MNNERICPFCGNILTSNDNYCRNCGKNGEEEKAKKKAAIVATIIYLVIFLLVFFFMKMISDASASYYGTPRELPILVEEILKCIKKL